MATNRAKNRSPEEVIGRIFDSQTDAVRVLAVDMLTDVGSAPTLTPRTLTGAPVVDEADPTVITDARFWDTYGMNNMLINVFFAGGTNPECTITPWYVTGTDLTYGEAFENARDKDDIVFKDILGRKTAFLVTDVAGAPTGITIKGYPR